LLGVLSTVVLGVKGSDTGKRGSEGALGGIEGDVGATGGACVVVLARTIFFAVSGVPEGCISENRDLDIVGRLLADRIRSSMLSRNSAAVA
jgi:hypothetical protein